jgi:flagellar hook-associated protein 1 FlgK
MTDIVSVASGAVVAYQKALGTVSNNIANVATDGYSRQEVTLQANPVAKTGNVFFGTGVMVEGIKRNYDAFIESNLRNSTSDLSSQEPMVSYTNRVIDIMGGTSMGLSSAIDQFFNSARSLSADPASSVLRGGFVRDSESLAARFGELSNQLNLVQEESNQALQSGVDDLNTLAKQLAQVNAQLVKQKSAATQPADLLDQRDNILRRMSTYAHINTRFSESGAVLVGLGPTLSRDLLVNGVNTKIISLEIDPSSPDKATLVLDKFGEASNLSGLSSGKLAGLLTFKEQVLGSSYSSLDTLANKLVGEVNAQQVSGIDAYGNPGTPLFKIDPQSIHSSSGIEIAFKDPMRIATASQFRVIEAQNNTGGVDAQVEYQPEALSGPDTLSNVLVNSASEAGAKVLQLTANRPFSPLATIPNGLSDISIYLGNASPGQDVQIFTRDGRQIAGGALSDALKGTLLTEENGFVSGASYSDAYLNKTGAESYKNLQVFYGAKAEAQEIAQWDMTNKDVTQHIRLPSTFVSATLEGGHMQGQLTSIQVGQFSLNGVDLPSADPLAGGVNYQAQDIADWLNASISTLSLSNPSLSHLSASAHNELRISPDKLKFGTPLSLNGVSIDITAGILSAKSLAEAIQAKNISGINATVTALGELSITSEDGSDISVGPGSNTLGIEGKLYRGQIDIKSNDTSVPISLGFGSGTPKGTPADLSKLGFRTAAYLKGSANEDLLVMVTGEGSANVAASYAGSPVDPKQSLRAQPLTLRFDSETHYTITDVNTGTVVASRNFDPVHLEPGVVYQGLKISFSNPPKPGDVFTLDGNRDGTGNNENILALIALGNKPIMGNGKTFAAAYIDHVNEVGNMARQATIAQTALKVVNDQAVAARDGVSGVSLDQEAADLIRFQQSYQAAAKVMQIASQLFDTVLQVR